MPWPWLASPTTRCACRTRCGASPGRPSPGRSGQPHPLLPAASANEQMARWPRYPGSTRHAHRMNDLEALTYDFLRNARARRSATACRAARRCAPTARATTRRGRRCCAATRARTAARAARQARSTTSSRARARPVASARSTAGSTPSGRAPAATAPSATSACSRSCIAGAGAMPRCTPASPRDRPGESCAGGPMRSPPTCAWGGRLADPTCSDEFAAPRRLIYRRTRRRRSAP